jgi:phage/plasmid-associated DNA primase
MTTIQFSKDLNKYEPHTINAHEYEAICKRTNAYEILPKDRPVKLYLDVDIKYDVDDDEEGLDYMVEMPRIRAMLQTVLSGFFKDKYDARQICISTSHHPFFRPYNTGKKALDENYKCKLSFHFVFNNIIALVAHQKLLVEKLNAYSVSVIDGDDRNNVFKGDVFDTAPYGRNQKIRSPYSNKPLENRPLKIETGTFEQSCISAFIPEGAFVWVEDIPERPVLMAGEARIQDTEKDRAIFNAGLELLRPYAQGGQYAHWIRIGWAIKNTFDDASLFHEFSKLGGKEYDRSSVEDYWYGMETSIDGVKMGTIIDYMRKTDKTKTDAILSMFSTSKEPPTDARNLLMEIANEDTDTDGETNSEQSVEQPKVSYYISIDKLEDPHECAKVITQTLKHTLVLCSEKWYMVSSDNLWATQSEPTYYITSEIRKYIDEGQKQTAHKISRAEGEAKDKLIEIQKRYLKAYRDISRPAFLSVITKNLKTLLCDRLFTEKIDKLTDHLAFKNGILNLKTRQFRRGILPSDYITQTIEYDYMPANPEKTQYVKDVLLKILNNNPEHLEYFLSIIGYTFIGRPKLEKAFYFCVDKTTSSKGDNGKTFYFDILSNLMACYVYKTQGNFLEKNNTKKHKQLAKMKASRLVWLDEFGTNNMDAEFVKTLGDGLTTENEVMFGTSETINIQFKVFGLTNHLIRMASNEDAVFNRYTQISYGSHFDKTGTRTVEEPNKLLFIADKTLSDRLIQDYRNEIFGLVIEYANRYYSSGLPKVPTQFQADAQETKINNDEFAMWIHENCIVDEDARVALKALVYESGMPEKKIKENMKRLGYVYNKELKGVGKDGNGKYYKGGYVGVKLNEKETENEDEEGGM